MLSISLQFRTLVVKHESFLIQQSILLPFLVLSPQRILYPGMLTSRSGTVWSSFDFVIPITVALVLLALHFNSSIFVSKLFIFKCFKYNDIFYFLN